MKSLVFKNIKHRSNFEKSELDQKIFKTLSETRSVLPFQQWWIKIYRNKFQKLSKTRANNQCLLTGRNRSVSRHYQLSRIKFRELGRNGEIIGLQKSSW